MAEEENKEEGEDSIQASPVAQPQEKQTKPKQAQRKTTPLKQTKTKELAQKPTKKKQIKQTKSTQIQESPSKEFHKEIKASGLKIPKLHLYIIVAAVILLAVLTFIFAKLPLKKQTDTGGENIFPGQGDSVSVWYIGRLENGTVFDTNKEDIAKQEGIFNENRTYELFTFRIGSQEVVPGFEEGVKTLKVGETKTFTLPPEKAYGKYDEKLIGRINRTQTQARRAYIQREFQLPKQILEQQNIEYKGKKELFVEPLKYEILSENDENLTLRINAKKGDTFQKFPYDYFDSKVVLVNKTDIGIELQAEKGDKYQTVIGEIEVVEVTDEQIKTKLNIEVGGTLITQFGQVTVKEVTQDEIILDSNHPLAGKTLIFEITLEKII